MPRRTQAGELPLALIAALLVAMAGSGCDILLLPLQHVAWGEAASERWVRIHHPELPITFEIPDNTRGPLRGLGWDFGSTKWPEEKDGPVPHWGIRAISREAEYVSYAVEFAFILLNTETPGVDRARVARLAANLDNGEAVIRFYRDVFDPKWIDLSFFDIQAEVIDGLPARAIGADQRFSEWEVSRHQLIVVPVNDDSVLVIGGRLWSLDLPEEREGLFFRIARSVRFDPGVVPD